MIQPEQVAEIKALLAQGLSRREIAARAHVSNQTIMRYDEEQRANRFRRCSPRRCKKCGGLCSVWPCMVCGIENAVANNQPIEELVVY